MYRYPIALFVTLAALVCSASSASAAIDVYKSTEEKARDCASIVRKVKNPNITAVELEKHFTDAKKILDFYQEAQSLVATAKYEQGAKEDAQAFKFRAEECRGALAKVLQK